MTGALHFLRENNTLYSEERPSLCRSSYCKLGADITLAPLFIFAKLKEELKMKPIAKHVNRNKRFRKSKVRSVAKDHKSFDYLIKKSKLN